MAATITDQPDSFIHDFAAQAEAAEALNIAGYALSMRADLTDYTDFLQRMGDNEGFDAYPIQNRSFGEGISWMHSFAVHLYGQDSGLLSILLNQSPQYVKGDVARAYLAELSAGNEGSATDADIAWDFILRDMVQRIGAVEAFQTLRAFEIGHRVRHYSGLSLDTLSWATAKLALLPYMRGDVENTPERPDYLSPEFDWALWVQIAQMVREDSDVRLNEEARVIAAELLFSSGDIAAALPCCAG